MAHNHDAAQSYAQLQDAKTKWDELQDVVLATDECESAFVEKVNNLEATLMS